MYGFLVVAHTLTFSVINIQKIRYLEFHPYNCPYKSNPVPPKPLFSVEISFFYRGGVDGLILVINIYKILEAF